MLKRFIQNWEVSLSKVDRHRKASAFDWGLEHLSDNATYLGETLSPDDFATPGEFLREFTARTVPRSEQFYAPPEPIRDWHLHDDWLTFPSSVETPYEMNNTAWVRYFPIRERPNATERPPVVLVLPQWNGDHASHVAVCQGVNAFGMASVLMRLPYHGNRRPDHQVRADYMVSPNIGRTIQSVRQAVHEVKMTLDWLEGQGYTKFGVIGTSIGSCVAFMAYVHDPRLKIAAFNHVSSYFADVVWTGISTSHVKEGLAGNITRNELRDHWTTISPFPFIGRMNRPEYRGHKTLLIAAHYDMTFLPHLSRQTFCEFERQRVPHQVAWMHCGHYTTGQTPFKFYDGYLMINHMRKHLNPGGHVVKEAIAKRLPGVFKRNR